MIACFLSNISAKYYKNPSMLSRVIAINVGDVFFETQCTCMSSILLPARHKYDGPKVLKFCQQLKTNCVAADIHIHVGDMYAFHTVLRVV